jgi:ATP-binding cassette subfamily C protein
MLKGLKGFSVFRVMGFVSWPQRLLVIGGLVTSGMVELLGLTMVAPILALAVRQDGTRHGFGQYVADRLQALGLPANIETLLALFVAMLVLKALISVAVAKYVADVMTTIAQTVRLHLARNLLHVKWSYFVRQPVGRLAALMGHEANAMGETFYVTCSFVSWAIHIVVYMAVATALSWELGIICLTIGLAMFLWFGRMVKKTRKAARRHAEQINSLAGNFGDTVTSIRPIKAMGRQARFAGLFEADAQRASRTMRAKVMSSEFSNEVQEPVIGLLLALGFYVAVRVWTLPIEVLILLGFILARTMLAFYGIQRVYHRIVVNEAHFDQVMRTLDETAREREDLSGTGAPQLEHGIRLEGVTFSYGVHPALTDVSLEIPARSIVALVGASGAGKSTLTDLIMGLQQPQQGRMLIDGQPLSDLDLLKWRAMIGYVPQDLTLFHDSVFRNVTLGDDAYDETAVRDALAAAGALEFVERLPGGLHHDVGERGLGLSGGQRQRISIARALVHRPRLLILDEPTTAIDPAVEREITANLRALAAAQNLTVLVISHQAAWHEIADTVVILEQGRVADVRRRYSAAAAAAE